MMRFEYDPKFIKLLAKEMVKEMQKVKSEAKEPELITVKEAAETLYFANLGSICTINRPLSGESSVGLAEGEVPHLFIF